MRPSRPLAVGLVAGTLFAALTGCSGSSTQPAGSSCSSSSACTAGGSGMNPRDLLGKSAPAVSGPDLTGSGDVSLNDYAGKPMAVVVWSISCPHCQHDLPEINALQAGLGTKAQIFSVAIHDPSAPGGPGFTSAAAAVDTLHLTVPTVTEERSVADPQWHLAFVPTVFILNSTHKVVDVVAADGSGSDITPAVRTALQKVA